MTNTFDTSSFIHKTMSDVGGIAAGKVGAVNLIPSMPGMGVVSSIEDQCKMLESQARISTRIVRMDQIENALVLDPTIDPKVGMADTKIGSGDPKTGHPDAKNDAADPKIGVDTKGAIDPKVGHPDLKMGANIIDARVVVIDVGTNNLTAAQQNTLVDFINQARNEAQVVWVVGGNTAEIAKALEGGSTQFQNTMRARRENNQVSPQSTIGNSFKS